MTVNPLLPRIGLTLRFSLRDCEQKGRDRDKLAHYRQAVEMWGAQANAYTTCCAVDTMALDGLLLGGGGDICPRLYNQPPHEKLGDVCCAWDEFEINLCKRALDSGMPILGICRGAQILGVSWGGELIQDIISSITGALKHRSDKPQVAKYHHIKLASDSRLAKIVGRKSLEVNSYHHQCNDFSKLGVGVYRAAWSDDGVTEAIEHEAEGFALGVQWHPERLLEDDASCKIFRAFVDAAQKYRRIKGIT